MPPDLTKILTANRSSAGREALHLGALLLKRGVNVEGKRGGDVGVPEDLRERLGVKALLNAARREGVAQGVEGILLKPVAAHQRFVAAVEAGGLGGARRGRQDEIPVVSAKARELPDEKFRQRDHPAGTFGLGLAYYKLSAARVGGIKIGNALDCSRDGDGAAAQIDVRPPKTADLPDPQPSEEREKHADAGGVLGIKQSALKPRPSAAVDDLRGSRKSFGKADAGGASEAQAVALAKGNYRLQHAEDVRDAFGREAAAANAAVLHKPLGEGIYTEVIDLAHFKRAELGQKKLFHRPIVARVGRFLDRRPHVAEPTPRDLLEAVFREGRIVNVEQGERV